MVRVPSVELIGKNANNRDVTIRFDIDDVPLSDEQWIAVAQERNLPVDAEKTRGNIIVGQHNGFAGLIKSYDSLDTVIVAAEVIRTCDQIHPEYKDALGTFARKQGMSVHDINLTDISISSIGPADSYYEMALFQGLTVSQHEIEDVINEHVDWETVLLQVKSASAEYIHTVSGVWYLERSA